MANATRKAGRYGKALPQFPTGLKEFKAYLKQGAALPAPPASVTKFRDVTAWPMFGNDQYGDCTMAAAAHAIQCWNAITAEKDRVPSDTAVVAEYFKLTGGADSGLVESNVLQTWQKQGLWRNKIVAYAPINVHDQTLLQQAVDLYGLAYVGIQVPQNAETQFQDKQPWTLVQGWQTQTIVGGHAIPVVGYDQQYLYVITWGEVQQVAYDWWQTYGDEAWAIVPNEFKEAGGYQNINLQQLIADLQGI
ncbi:MAG: hypothetical protein JO269_03185 [Burkholderiaceae bacterium]|nr:hypothetical protein [Burkholderiaceae bacterium]